MCNEVIFVFAEMEVSGRSYVFRNSIRPIEFRLLKQYRRRV